MAAATNFDPAVEQALLAAVLREPKHLATAVTAGVTASTFVGHGDAGTVWQAIETVDTIDPVTVAAWLDQHHPRDPRWAATISAWVSSPDYTEANAPKYAELLVGLQRERWLDGELLSLLNGQRPRAREKMGEIVATIDGWAASSTSEGLVADMQAVLDGKADVILPNLAPRDDRATCLLYGPGINWLDGEPGRGKTMLAAWWTYRELVEGRSAVYIQFEGEGNRHKMGARLAQMGLRDASNLHYVHCSGAWTPAELAELRALFNSVRPSLVVVDSVASAMQAEGLDPESNRDVEKWKATIPSWAVAADAALLALDHLTKNPEQRGRYSIGAQRKLGIADVSYRLHMHQEPGLGRTGYGRLEVMKDREGALGEYQDGRVIAEVSIASETDGDGGYELRVGLMPPSSATGSTATGPSWYMERVSRELEAFGPLGKVELRTRVGKRKDQVDLAIERLLDEGAIETVDAKGRAKPYASVYPWAPPVPARSFYEKEIDEP